MLAARLPGPRAGLSGPARRPCVASVLPASTCAVQLPAPLRWPLAARAVQPRRGELQARRSAPLSLPPGEPGSQELPLPPGNAKVEDSLPEGEPRKAQTACWMGSPIMRDAAPCCTRGGHSRQCAIGMVDGMKGALWAVGQLEERACGLPAARAGLKIEPKPDTDGSNEVEYDEATKTVRIPLSAASGQRRTKLVMFTCNKCGEWRWLSTAQRMVPWTVGAAGPACAVPQPVVSHFLQSCCAADECGARVPWDRPCRRAHGPAGQPRRVGERRGLWAVQQVRRVARAVLQEPQDL
jgi:hypothetical protein